MTHKVWVYFAQFTCISSSKSSWSFYSRWMLWNVSSSQWQSLELTLEIKSWKRVSNSAKSNEIPEPKISVRNPQNRLLFRMQPRKAKNADNRKVKTVADITSLDNRHFTTEKRKSVLISVLAICWTKDRPLFDFWVIHFRVEIT